EAMRALTDHGFALLTPDFRRRLGVEHKPFVKKKSTEIAAVTNGDSAPADTAGSEALQELIARMDQELPGQPALDDLLSYAFAACREAGRRTKNMRHFDVQIIGGAVLHH